MRYANLIFDFDGTLVDSKHDIASAQAWVLQQLGVHTAHDRLFRYIGKPLEETFAAVLPKELHDRIPEATDLYAEYYRPRALATTRLFPGVRETLEALHARGARMAVASTKKGPGILKATDHFGITHFFVQLQGSDGFPFKPDPAIINKIIEDQHWDRSETMMVGDTDYDILAGRNAGIATCAVTYGSFDAEQLKPFHPDFIIERFPELLSLVE
jgi:phosphoglycolate phosphatase